MRVHPPVSLISRCLEHDTDVDGRIIKAGTQADVQIYALHHHPDYWDKPQVRCCDEMTRAAARIELVSTCSMWIEIALKTRC